MISFLGVKNLPLTLQMDFRGNINQIKCYRGTEYDSFKAVLLKLGSNSHEQKPLNHEEKLRVM